MKVSLIIPAKNEEMNLGLVLDDLNKTISQMPGYEFEVIVVDDRSTDGTGDVARARGARVIRNDGPSGKGCALRRGFENASGGVFMMMDADYSHRAEEIPVLLATLKDGVGLVIGSRVYGGSEEYTPIRALGNVFLTFAVGLFLKRYLSDALNGFKAFRREVFTDFRYTSKAFEIEIELIANTLRKNYQVVEVISHERARLGGEAKSRVIRHGTRFFWRVFVEWLHNKRIGFVPARPRPQQPESPMVRNPDEVPPE